MAATCSLKVKYNLGNDKTETKTYGNISPSANDADVAAVAAQINNLQNKVVEAIYRVDTKQIGE